MQTHSFSTDRWSPDKIWHHEAIVQWQGESFRAEGLQNVSIPCDSSHEIFYVSIIIIMCECVGWEGGRRHDVAVALQLYAELIN